jgi:hypothetical protein
LLDAKIIPPLSRKHQAAAQHKDQKEVGGRGQHLGRKGGDAEHVGGRGDDKRRNRHSARARDGELTEQA